MYQISCYHDMLTLYHHDILQQMNNVISLWIKYTKWIPLSSWLSINLWYSISWSICFLKYTFLQTEYLLHLVVTKINKSVINLCYKNKTVFSANKHDKRFLDLLDNSYQNNVGLKQIGRKPTRVISFNKFSWLIYFNRFIHTLTSCYKEKKMTEEHKLFFFHCKLKIFNIQCEFCISRVKMS